MHVTVFLLCFFSAHTIHGLIQINTRLNIFTSDESAGRLSTSAEAKSLKTPPDLHNHIQHNAHNIIIIIIIFFCPKV